MLFDLADFESYFGPLRLFRYLTFRCALAMVLSFVIGMACAPKIIDTLRAIKFGQSFRTKDEVGRLAELHSGKKGTPAMGGIIIFLAVMASSLLLARMNALVFCALFVYTAFTALGFADDYLKIVKKKDVNLTEVILDKDIITKYFTFYYNSTEGDDSNNCIYLLSTDIKLPLKLRTKRNGDKMYIKNLNGSKKISDIFIDSKLPKEERINYPILVDASDTIIWLPGLKKSQFAKDKSEKYDIIIKCEAR